MTSLDTRYRRFLARLYRQNEFAMKLGLDAMRRALELRRSPHTSARHVLVAGTNGKGSVASALANILTVAARAHTGLFTSPHLVDFAERIRIDGERIDRALLLDIGTAALAELGGESDATSAQNEAPTLTYFELATMMAAEAFNRRRCELAVYEVGLGGRLDATNALDPDLVVVTEIGLDHTGILGDTLAQIAAEKANIARPQRPAVVGTQTAAGSVVDVCRSRGAAPIYVLGDDFDVVVGTSGIPRFDGLGATIELPALASAAPHELRNAATAIASALTLSRAVAVELETTRVASAIERTRWPGRMWRLGADRVERALGHDVEVLLDAAHNAAGAEALAHALAQRGWKPGAIVLNTLSSKDGMAIIDALRALEAPFVVAPIDSPRALAPQTFCERAGLQPRAAAPTLEEALRRAAVTAGDLRRVLVTGSIYLLGEVIAALGLEADLRTTLAPEHA